MLLGFMLCRADNAYQIVRLSYNNTQHQCEGKYTKPNICRQCLDDYQPYLGGVGVYGKVISWTTAKLHF